MVLLGYRDLWFPDVLEWVLARPFEGAPDILPDEPRALEPVAGLSGSVRPPITERADP
jgi:hypothetical protein